MPQNIHAVQERILIVLEMNGGKFVKLAQRDAIVQKAPRIQQNVPEVFTEMKQKEKN